LSVSRPEGDDKRTDYCARETPDSTFIYLCKQSQAYEINCVTGSVSQIQEGRASF